ncbi:uncharacterized protein Dmoj_GI25970 [Drosophila mojavensis]|uniref:Serpin domain-containing protein n=2 Tax=Drosophila mojavensis TaxID=7230 RepID=A0A0Q9XB12_DROMO|nr:uncharacterized protein Dmoj_GI25970 [Drosophila mojavensis]
MALAARELIHGESINLKLIKAVLKDNLGGNAAFSPRILIDTMKGFADISGGNTVAEIKNVMLFKSSNLLRGSNYSYTNLRLTDYTDELKDDITYEYKETSNGTLRLTDYTDELKDDITYEYKETSNRSLGLTDYTDELKDDITYEYKETSNRSLGLTDYTDELKDDITYEYKETSNGTLRLTDYTDELKDDITYEYKETSNRNLGLTDYTDELNDDITYEYKETSNGTLRLTDYTDELKDDITYEYKETSNENLRLTDYTDELKDDITYEYKETSNRNLRLTDYTDELKDDITYEYKETSHRNLGLTDYTDKLSAEITDEFDTPRELTDEINEEVTNKFDYTVESDQFGDLDETESRAMSDVTPINSAIFASKEVLPALGNTAQEVNFNDPQNALQTINDWVAQQTKRKIKNFIDRIEANMKMILISTASYEVEWKYKFNPKLTKKESFYTSLTQTIPVDMMSISGRFYRRYIKSIDADVLQLPFAKKEIKMTILLPRKINGIDKLLESLTTLELKNLKFSGKPTKLIDVKLPKFKVDFKVDLKKSMQGLGVHDLFSNANFPNITNHGVMKVNAIVQNVAVEVSERGALFAFAARAPSSTPKFVVDHPFVFLIRRGNDVFFAGRVNFADN